MGKHNKGQTKKEREEMKHQINVASKEEGAAVEKALGNPVTKAVVVVEGVLSGLTPQQRDRVVKFVQESLDGVITGDEQ